ncbi:hypothetical protein pdam_00018469 [Pocillopora damicornis]|uniref:Uncharacterized protein n=1 Tax=Pocillopora damicornis TaxID=46731 RepID=A0A3M6UE67_POCDA|nr:hypothetical protein pdam_00018469 [Pocillopora damicornis]
MVQLSCSFATNCRTKCYFSRAGQGRQQLIPLNSWVNSLKKKHSRDVDVSQTYVSSEKKLILARIGFFGDYEGRDFTIYLKYRAQLDLRVSKCQYPPHKNRRHRVGRDVNLQMIEEIKAGGESSWWQALPRLNVRGDVGKYWTKNNFKHGIYPRFPFEAGRLSSGVFHRMYRVRSPRWFAICLQGREG